MVPLWSSDWMHNRPLLALLVVCLPMTLLWMGAVLHCVRACARSGHLGGAWMRPGERALPEQGSLALDAPSWLLLLLLTGWMGTLAYLAVLLLPRVEGAWRRLHCPVGS